GLAAAVAELRRKGLGDVCRRVMDDLFRFDPVTQDSPDVWEGEDAVEADGPPQASRLAESLAPLFDEPWLADRLEQLAGSLSVEPTDGAFSAWMQGRLADTVGEAVAIACSYLVPAFTGTDVLVLDILDRSEVESS